VKIDILPLTEVIGASGARRAGIDVYVSLLDPFGSQIKSPGKFRFELYEYVQRSAEPKGRRVFMWEEVDLTDPTINNESWHEYFHAYEFNLDFEQAGSRDYRLEVTCMCPNGKRLSSEFTLRHTE
jgi:hypothetical protein